MSEISQSDRVALEAGGLAAFSGGFASWPTLQPLLTALERPHQGLAQAVIEQIAETTRPLAHALPTAAAIFFYDVLRTVAEAQRPGRTPLPEAERLGLVGVLGGQPDAERLIATFVAEAERLFARSSPAHHAQHPVAQRAQRFIEAHAGEKLSLARVAREIGVTRTYLSALFRRECGVTLTEYIHYVRIERAENYLRTGGLSMAEIAELSGYGSYRHFHRSFLKLRQVSPRVFVRALAGPSRRQRNAFRVPNPHAAAADGASPAGLGLS